MSTDTPDPRHEYWAQLAAGHALSSLAPDEEAIFAPHLDRCATCRDLVRDVEEVMAAIAQTAPAVPPPPQLKASLMSQLGDVAPAGAPEQPRQAPEQPAPRQSRQTVRSVDRRLRLALAACLVVLAALGAAAAWLHAAGSPPSIADRCAAQGCPVITLRDNGQPAGTIMVLDHTVYIDASGLPSAPSGFTYVLWAIEPTKSPVGLAAFDNNTAEPVRAGTLHLDLSKVSAFAVSKERGHAIPPSPTNVLAIGQVTR